MARKIGAVFLLIALVFVFLTKPALADVANSASGIEGHDAIEKAGGVGGEIIRGIIGDKEQAPDDQPQFAIRGCQADYGNLFKTISWAVGATLARLGLDFLSDLEIGLEIAFLGSNIGFDLDLITNLLEKWQNALFWGLAASLSLFISGWLWEAGLALNMTLLENNVLVNAGFPIMLSVANIGFILILIAAALLTILGLSDFRGWNIGSIMPRLVAAIFLVNFSQLFANVILQASTALMSVFLGNQCVGNTLFNFFNMGTLNTQISNFLFGGGGWWNGILGILSSPLTTSIAALLTVIIALTVIVLVVFLFIRYVVVSLLIIFMPIAWLGLAAPGLKISGLGNPWDAWWKEFLKWMIFGPLIAFFVLLSAHFIAADFEPIAGDLAFIKSALQVAGFVIISFGGLLIANKMSRDGSTLIMGAAGLAVGGAQKLGGMVKGKAAQLKHQADRIQSQDPDRAARLRASAKKWSSISAGMTAPGGLLKAAMSQAGIKPPAEPKLDKERMQKLASRAILGGLRRDPSGVLRLDNDEIKAGLEDPTKRGLIEGAMQNLVAGFSSLTPDQQRNYAKTIRKMESRGLVRKAVLARGDAEAIINLLINEDYAAINTDPEFAHDRANISRALADLIDPGTRAAEMTTLTSGLSSVERARFENRFNAIPRSDICRMVLDLLRLSPPRHDATLSLSPSDLRNFTNPDEQRIIGDSLLSLTPSPASTLLLNRIGRLERDGRWSL